MFDQIYFGRIYIGYEEGFPSEAEVGSVWTTTELPLESASPRKNIFVSNAVSKVITSL